jgi:hypothetical protein
MTDANPSDNSPKANDAPGENGLPKKTKKEKVPVDPAQRGPGGFDRSILRGKNPIFRKQKKAGR